MTMAGLKFQTVTLANRPAAATYGVGFLVASDQDNTMYYSDGATWTVVGGGTTLRPNRSNRPWKINGIGDSITARNEYHPITVPTTNGIPLWVAGTAVSLSQVYTNSVGQLFYVTTAGATGATEPSWNATGTTADGTAVWTAYVAYSGKDAASFLTQAEVMSNGALDFDQSVGYAFPEFSCLKVLVVSGGAGYQPTDTLTFSNTGVSATLTVVNGAITAVTMTNVGRFATGTCTVTINTSTGSGAVLSVVHSNSGTFGVSGCRTRDMLARVADAAASRADILTVLGGTNDCTLDVTTFADAATQYTITIANLKTIYETLLAAGKKVIAIPILPRTGLTAPKLAFVLRVNRWIRAYCKKEVWANSNAAEVSLADATRYWTTNVSSFSPIGGAGGTNGSVTVDGLHPSPLGAQLIGMAVLDACRTFVDIPTTPARSASYGDGYSLSYNEGGNLLEGLPWTASTSYVVGDLVSNDTAPVKVYRVTVAGTSAGSGGPTGTGSPVDNTVTWTYVRDFGLSVLGSGTAGTNTAAGGITFVGSLCTGLTLARQTGTAAGTITENIESPWTDGQIGTRQSIAFSLGSGGATELWRVLITNFANATMGILSTELANKYYTLEVELDISGAANMYMPYTQLFGQSAVVSAYSGFGIYSGGGGAAGYEMLPTTGNVLTIPNNGRLLLRTQPMQLPVGTTSLNTAIYFGFNASGAAGSATAVVKINNITIRKAYV